MFRITIIDLETNLTVTDATYEHVETTVATGTRKVSDDDIVKTGEATLLVKAWTGERSGMETFEDFVNYSDESGPIPV